MSASDYGKFYWGVDVPHSICEEGEIYVHADKMVIHPTGALVFSRERGNGEEALLILNVGEWNHAWAASVWDGSKVAVEWWGKPKGDVL